MISALLYTGLILSFKTHIILFMALDFKRDLDPLQYSQVNFQASSISSMFLMCLLKVAQFIVKFA